MLEVPQCNLVEANDSDFRAGGNKCSDQRMIEAKWTRHRLRQDYSCDGVANDDLVSGRCANDILEAVAVRQPLRLSSNTKHRKTLFVVIVQW